MINPFNMHRNGMKMVDMGVDLTELEKAVVIEMMPMNPARMAQARVNEALIEASKGLMAPSTGKEKYCSLGTGHAIAFIRAGKAGCKTPV